MLAFHIAVPPTAMNNEGFITIVVTAAARDKLSKATMVSLVLLRKLIWRVRLSLNGAKRYPDPTTVEMKRRTEHDISAVFSGEVVTSEVEDDANELRVAIDDKDSNSHTSDLVDSLEPGGIMNKLDPWW